MKSEIIKCLPVFALAVGLAACGDKATSKPSGGGGPAAVQSAKISTKVEADCGNGAVAASNTDYDLTECQLNANHMTLLQEVGPFKVEADCTRHAIRIKNAADQIAGEGPLDNKGVFSLKLTA